MEEISDAIANVSLNDNNQKKNRIQVSNTKQPLFFYVNLAKAKELGYKLRTSVALCNSTEGHLLQRKSL